MKSGGGVSEIERRACPSRSPSVIRRHLVLASFMPESPASPNTISWASLLAHWTQVAQASLALPRDAEGDRWRAAVPSIIVLQAVTHALAEVAGFAYAQRDERALAQDKSELLIKEHAGALHALWKTEPLPDLLREMINDARIVQRRTHEGGLEWRLKGKDAKGRVIEHAELEHPSELAAALLSLDVSDAAGGGAGSRATCSSPRRASASCRARRSRLCASAAAGRRRRRSSRS